MRTRLGRDELIQRQVALPTEHGSWVFLLLPLGAGLALGKATGLAPAVLSLAALAAFLLRQPVTVMVKIASKRRDRGELPAAMFWAGIYAAVALIAAAWLVIEGYGYVLFLAVPALPVFAWHLWLIRRRAERRKPGVEVVAAGALALAAPAAFWVSRQDYDPAGWLMWLLFWLQGAASIIHTYLRLEQRAWETPPPTAQRVRSGRRALLYSGFNLAFVLALTLAQVTSAWLPLAFCIQFAESVFGTLAPAIGAKPTHIGIRQTVVSVLFGVLFILCW